MGKKKRRLLNMRDFCFIAGLILLALGIYLWQVTADKPQASYHARIVINGHTAEYVDLSDDRFIYLEYLPNVRFQVRDGAIAFIKSDCPDQICVHSGFINRPGQMAVCLPNRCSISVFSTAPNEYHIDMTLR